MNRRGFLTALGALATTAVLPSIPSIPIVDSVRLVHKLALNSLYGKFGNGAKLAQVAHWHYGGRVISKS